MVLAFPRAGLRQASGTNSPHWCPNKRQPTEPTGPHVEKGLAAKASDLEFFPLRRHRSIRRETANFFFPLWPLSRAFQCRIVHMFRFMFCNVGDGEERRHVSHCRARRERD